MEICVLNPFFHPYSGGTEKALLQLYSRLSKRHNITVISASLDPKGKTERETIAGIDVIRLRADYLHVPYLPLPFVTLFGLNSKLKEVGADIYHINNRYQFFPNNVRAIRRMGKRSVLTIHNALPTGIDTFTDKGGLFYDVMAGRRVMHLCDAVTGVSRNSLVTTLTAADLKKAHTIFNGVDYQSFRPRSPSSRPVRKIAGKLNLKGKIILTNGRLIPQKGQIYLMEAVSKLVGQGRDISLLIIGRGYLKDRFMELSKTMELEGRFAIVSGIPEEELAYHYNTASVFVIPSLYEPASIALLEALASSIPTVASRTGGIPEMMKKTGLYVRPKDSKGIGRGIEALLDKKVDTCKLARDGRQLMIREHDWDKIAGQYETLFESLL